MSRVKSPEMELDHERILLSGDTVEHPIQSFASPS